LSFNMISCSRQLDIMEIVEIMEIIDQITF
jgi:hypothetical protein